ncbi:MAG: tetratricopeptide repeat protein [Burkholderiales bacterium]|nr:tetratricopeptide repeat protein [Burkholderiales bacterium]
MTSNRAPQAEQLLQQGITDQQAGRLPQAEAAYRQLLSANPRDPDALHLLGLVAHQVGRNDVAATLIAQAIAVRPDVAMYHANLGHVCTVLKRLDEAVVACERGIALDPAHAPAYLNLGNALKELGRIEEAIGWFEKLCVMQPRSVAAHSNLLYTLHYSQGRSQGEVFKRHRDFADRFEAPLRQAVGPAAGAAGPGRRLRIGYLSPDLREHPVAYYLEPVLEHHDRTGFEITCYFDHLQADAFTQRLKERCEHWVPCTQLDDEALAARIRADGIDILVDLAGHTAGNRLLVFARKPAPVQVTWLGYVGTTGLSAMDWRLTHPDADPTGNDAFYSEALHRFERSLWWTYRPRDGMPGVAPCPAVANRFVTFGSTNNIGKLNPAVIAAWADILRAVPDSRLLLAGIPPGSATQSLLAAFDARGIAPQRVIPHGKLDPERFWALHHDIDIALDPFPYNGGATACDALWLGLPMVALEGEAFVSRMGATLLRHLGLAELVAPDAQGYTALAVALARDIPRLAALRAGMRDRVAASALRDEAGFTKELEVAFQAMWQRLVQPAAHS